MANRSVRSRILANPRVLRTAQRVRDRIVDLAAPTPELREWRREDLYRKLQLTYDLDSSSLVFDVGGFEGQWSSDIAAMYACQIAIFEPVPAYSTRIEQRFIRNPSITVHPYGLAGTTGAASLKVAGDASSHVANTATTDAAITVALRSAEDVFAELPAGRDVALMKMNIEGAEYELVEHLIETSLIERVRDLQVQFHRDVTDAEARMLAIRELLRRTHQTTYAYDFLWENWHRQ